MTDYDYTRPSYSPEEHIARYRVLEEAVLFQVDSVNYFGYGKTAFILPDGIGVLTKRFPNQLYWMQRPYASMKSVRINEQALAADSSILLRLAGAKEAKNVSAMFEAFKKSGKLPSSLAVVLFE